MTALPVRSRRQDSRAERGPLLHHGLVDSARLDLVAVNGLEVALRLANGSSAHKEATQDQEHPDNEGSEDGTVPAALTQ